MNIKISKELIIILLLFVVILFVVGILFYDLIPSNAEEFTSIDYESTADVNKILNEIGKQSDSNSNITSFKVTQDDLKEEVEEYEPGKVDPFAETIVETEVKKEPVKNPLEELNKQEEKVQNVAEEVKQEVKEETKVENKIENKVENTVQTKTENKVTNETQGTFFEKPNYK